PRLASVVFYLRDALERRLGRFERATWAVEFFGGTTQHARFFTRGIQVANHRVGEGQQRLDTCLPFVASYLRYARCFATYIERCPCCELEVREGSEVGLNAVLGVITPSGGIDKRNDHRCIRTVDHTFVFRKAAHLRINQPTEDPVGRQVVEQNRRARTVAV